MGKTKTGECYYRDDEGQLWLAESFVDGKGVTTTETRGVDDPGGVVA